MRADTSKSQITTAIILAAGKVSPSIAAVFGQSSVGLLPLNGRPIIHWAVRYLQDVGVRRVILAVRPEDERLRRFATNTLSGLMAMNLVTIAEDRGPGFTLLRCLEQLDEKDSALVVLGDTLFTFASGFQKDLAHNFVLTASVEDARRWCFADVQSDGMIAALNDKPEIKVPGQPALIGVYYFHEISSAKDALAQAAQNSTGSIQLSVALTPYIQRSTLQARAAGEWFDCGNLDLLTSSRRRLLQSRSFNTMEVDELRGTVTKRSGHRQKFVNEINYYRLLPPDLAIFFPRVVDHSLDPADTYLTLEYYGYETLSELWVFEEFDAAYWQGIFRRLAQILEQLGRYTMELSPASVFRFYWLKTAERLEEFTRQSAEAAGLAEAGELRVNGTRCLGWPRLREQVELRIRSLAEKSRGQIIHGDFCLPNILFDPLNRVVKLLDPRGSFGDAGIFGDARYDAAKLLHSIHGGYDFIVHDMFRVQANGAEIKVEQFFPEVRPAVLDSFREIFGAQFDLRDVEFIEALLFVSMAALHRDAPARQTAMFATGIKLLNQSLNS